ncbi:iron ABC transporter permease [Loigolactobacillus bifermentans]|uniref:Ferrichrome import ABC transporter permease FhuB n=1 Tax=Loigolactobacillus bifermentans DSM 20003 TaxID=1423726 RepID=A0A0R1GEF5_9LACO|nr:iron ABC transporter permease [Loigolactobacillus bifermentans]KRK32606.1 ferrichrome import ABC transporter permease FhuB [Loigolactobacillus bifermentans DSM 20003]QGG60273.1 iron chelate uptake ABC transporter family permease subunit [Loigolactobacillus bifermentans]
MRHRTLVTSLLVGLLVVAFILDVCSGPTWFSPLALFHPRSTLQAQTITSIRLPRALAALIVGSALAVSGQLLQTIARNPIADPAILGVNSGANLALILGTILGVPFTMAARFGLALLGALLAFGCVLGLSMTQRGLAPLRLILGGTIFSGFLVSVAYGLSLLTQTTARYRNLLVGGFSGTTYDAVKWLLPIAIIAAAGIFWLKNDLTLLALNDQLSQSLGNRTTRTRFWTALIIVLCAGASVAVAGNIAFVGLGIPQCIALISGQRFKQTVGQVALAGGAFLCLGDTLAKAARPPFELPLGALTAILGGLFLFIFLGRGQGVRYE